MLVQQKQFSGHKLSFCVCHTHAIVLGDKLCLLLVQIHLFLTAIEIHVSIFILSFFSTMLGNKHLDRLS